METPLLPVKVDFPFLEVVAPLEPDTCHHDLIPEFLAVHQKVAEGCGCSSKDEFPQNSVPTIDVAECITNDEMIAACQSAAATRLEYQSAMNSNRKSPVADQFNYENYEPNRKQRSLAPPKRFVRNEFNTKSDNNAPS